MDILSYEKYDFVPCCIKKAHFHGFFQLSHITQNTKRHCHLKISLRVVVSNFGLCMGHNFENRPTQHL
jgi:hypothetical protein